MTDWLDIMLNTPTYSDADYETAYEIDFLKDETAYYGKLLAEAVAEPHHYKKAEEIKDAKKMIADFADEIVVLLGGASTATANEGIHSGGVYLA